MNVVTASPTSCNSQHQLFCKQVECQRQNLILSPHCYLFLTLLLAIERTGINLLGFLSNWSPFLEIVFYRDLPTPLYRALPSLSLLPTVTIILQLQAGGWLASFPGSGAGEEEREPGTHCLQVGDVLTWKYCRCWLCGAVSYGTCL